jgi:LysM repeat protein
MARGKSHVRIAFYTIVAVHLLVIGGLLIIGCKREDKGPEITGDVPVMTNDLSATPPFGSDPAVVSPTPPPVDTNPPSLVSTTPPTPSVTDTGLTSIPPVPTPTLPPPPPIDNVEVVSQEHTIVARDTFGSLAAKYGVSVKAIQAANPGVDPTKLKIGQKVKIPPKAPARNGAAFGAAPAAISDSYVVKSGDNLSKIAKAHGTTVRDLQRLNNLSTTQIRVGQKLKVPPRTGSVPGGPAPAQ